MERLTDEDLAVITAKAQTIQDRLSEARDGKSTRKLTLLKRLLDSHGIRQRELASGIGRSEAIVSRLLSGEVGFRRDVINATLSWLSGRLGRQITYDEVFGSPVEDLSNVVGIDESNRVAVPERMARSIVAELRQMRSLLADIKARGYEREVQPRMIGSWNVSVVCDYCGAPKLAGRVEHRRVEGQPCLFLRVVEATQHGRDPSKRRRRGTPSADSC